MRMNVQIRPRFAIRGDCVPEYVLARILPEVARRGRGDSFDVELVRVREKPDKRLLVVRLVRKVRQDKQPRLRIRSSGQCGQ